MAVKLPTLNPIALPQSAPAGRIQVQAPDTSNYESAQTESLGKVASTIDTVLHQQTVNAADTFSKDAAIKYQAQFDDLFEGKDGLKYKKGQEAYTTGYADTVAKLKQYKESILAANPDASEYTKAFTTQKFNQMDEKFHSTLTTWAGKTQADHEAAVSEATTTIYQKDLIHDMALYNPNDPTTLGEIKTTLAKISVNREDSAIKNGLMQVDANGVKTVDATVQVQIAKDKSDGLYHAIANVAATPGQAQKAQQLYEEFAPQLDEVNKPLLKTKIETAALNDKSLKNVQSLIGGAKTPDQVKAAIMDIKDPKEQTATLNAYYNFTSKMDRIANIADKESYNNGYAYIVSRQQGSNPFTTIDELHRDSVYQGLKIKDAKKVEALDHLILAPKNSNQEQLDKVSQAYVGGQFKDMSVQDKDLLIAGLDKTARNRYSRLWEEANVESKTAQSKSQQWMLTNLDEQMQSAGIIKKQYGKYSNKDQIKINEARNEMIDQWKNFSKFPDPNSEEAKNYIKDFAFKHLKDELAVPEPPAGAKKAAAAPNVFKTGEKNETTSVTTGAPLDQSVINARVDSSKKFKTIYGRWPQTGTNELDNYIAFGNKDGKK